MLLMSLAVSLVVASSPAEDAPTSAQPLDAAAVEAPPDALNFDALPEPPKSDTLIGDEKRVQRFLGALAGGLVGFGAVTAFVPLAETQGCFGCIGAGQVLLGIASPVVGVLGAWLGSWLMGGEAGPMTGFMAMIPALLVALGLAVAANAMDLRTTAQHVPFIVIAGAFLAGGAALALDVREQQLARLGRAHSWGGASASRITLTSATSALSGALAAFLSVALGVLNPVAGIVGGVVQSFGVAAATWGVHRALGGRGTFGASLGAFGLGGALTFAAVGLMLAAQSGSAFNSLRSTSAPVLAIELGAVAALFLPALALEWSHTDAVAARLPKLSIGAAPTSQGGMVSAGLQF